MTTLIPIIRKILWPEKRHFQDDKELECFVWDRCRELSRLPKKIGLSKGGVGYTFFIPNEDLRTGKWAECSPTFFWGLNKEEQEDALLSSFLYYLWPKQVPSYTELWLIDLSGKLSVPLDIQMLMEEKEEKIDNKKFSVKIEKELGLITILFLKEVFEKLNSFHKSCIKYLKKQIPSRSTNSVSKFDSTNMVLKFNFREIERYITTDLGQKMGCIQDELDKLFNGHDIEAIIKSLNTELSKEFSQIISNSIETQQMESLSHILVKLLLIGHTCNYGMRILHPKQFLTDNNELVGISAGILRMYDPMEKNLMINLYQIGYPLIYNIGFRLLLHYMDQFRLHHALRSAVAAIMARNMSHNIGSHVLNYVSNPEELDDLWVT